jgi:RNA polymerase sigma-70 factor (sigma-E family)
MRTFTRRGRDKEFSAFAAARWLALRRTAFLLTGDWHEAEDVVQTALVKLYVAWPRVRAGTAEAYARTTVTRVFLDGRRKRSATELSVADVPDGRPTPTGSVDARGDLVVALRALPRGQRAVVVLRYWDDLSVEQTAAAVGVSPGTVKSQSSKGLQALREHLGRHYAEEAT